MREKLIIIILILSGLLVNSNVSYGCNTPPEAILKVLRQYVIVGKGVVLDGSSSHDVGGSIVKFEFDFDVDGDNSYDYWETSSFYPDGAFDGRTIHIYSSNTVCTVKLRVTDNGGLTDTDTCTVHVGPDSDNDDMPDEWETLYNLVVGTDDAEDDKDEDTYNNLCEYLHGTNPANPESKPNGSSYIITIHVPDDVRSIQRAINASINGDTIVVAEGTYTNEGIYEQNVHCGIDFSNGLATGTRAIIVRSTNPNDPTVVAATIIDCQGNEQNKRRGFYFHRGEGSNSVLSGFTIKNGYHEKGGGIYCESASPTITNCVISDNTASLTPYGGGGMYIQYGNPKVKNCVFSRNTASFCGGGVLICQTSLLFPATFVNCIFVSNSAFYGGGMYNYNSPTKIINCTFNQNCASAGNSGGLQIEEYEYYGSPLQITNCIFWGNENTQIYYDDGQAPVVNNSCIQGGWTINGTGNTGENPCFLNAEAPAGLDGIFATEDDGLLLPSDSPYSPCIDTGNNTAIDNEGATTDIIGNLRKADGNHDDPTPPYDTTIVDMGAYEVVPVWYVDITKAGGDGKSWTNAFKYLQDILNNTNLKAGDEIWVAKGDDNYKPDRGGGKTPGDRSASFVLKTGVDIYGGFAGTEALRSQRDWLKNVTTLSGDIDGDGFDNHDSYNVVKGADNATLDGFTITGGNANLSIYDGGGIYCYYTSPRINNCIITGNYAYSQGGGIYCYYASPVVTNCTITANSAIWGAGVANRYSNLTLSNCIIKNNQAVYGSIIRAGYGGGMYNIYSPVSVTNCIFSGNTAAQGFCGGMYNFNSSPTVTNCVFCGNSAKSGGGMYNYGSNSKPLLTNCTFSKNYATNGSGGGMYNYYYSTPALTNCILWLDTATVSGPEIYNSSYSTPTISHCDIQGCRDDNGTWVPGFGTDLGGNINQDPRFANSSNPAGEDGILGTSDDGLRLKGDSPCIDTANGNMATDTDVLEDKRRDIDFVLNAGIGGPDYTDIGAYEYDNSPGYTTSFETYQGYVVNNTVNGIDGWKVEEGSSGAYVFEAKYMEDNGQGGSNDYFYQRVRMYYNSTISYSTSDSCDKTFARINCIPSPGSFIDVMNGSALVASIKFGDVVEGEHAYIWVLDNGSYVNTSIDYFAIAAQCRAFLTSPETYYNNPAYPYSYENTWIEFTIQFNWENHSYKVFWKHWGLESPADIYPEARFSPAHQCYTKVEFKTGSNLYFTFELNRISVSDVALGDEGGIVGSEDDVWLIAPEADILNPLKGRCIVAGPMWYDILGEYIVKCCPADLDSADPDNWITVCSGKTVNRDATTVGYWNTEAFYNGDYFLKIEVYDDLRRKHNEGIITVDRSFNGRPPEPCKVKYPVIGRAKARTFHYEELPDFNINWPGTFPFEFKRTYNNGSRARILPLFCGWTHNHNIRLIEDCKYDWITDGAGKPAYHDDKLGIGRLWLCQPLGGEMFIGSIHTEPHTVIYKPLDKENHYIIRTVNSVDTTDPDKPKFDVTYVYYAPDGMTLTFNKVFTGPWAVPADEGLVGWMVVAGIDEQADRFGNKLVYEWSGVDEQDEQDIFLDKISNNRTPAKLVFAYELGPGLCSSITLSESDQPGPDDPSITFGITSDEIHGFQYYAVIPTYRTIGSGEGDTTHTLRYFHNAEQEFMLTLIFPEVWWEELETIITEAQHSDDGTFLQRVEGCTDPVTWEVYNSDWALHQLYDYEYDIQGNLITTTEVKFGGPGAIQLLRKEIAVTSPEGALLSNNIQTFKSQVSGGGEFDPCNYQDFGDWISHYTGEMFYIQKHMGGGGAIDTEYDYENNDFPLKPTRITEYFDDDGDGDYDRPSKETRIEYDSRGNVLNRRVYVDSTNFVYTEYAYHQNYNFPIKGTTWQGYCYESGGNVIKTGARVEKKWLYGNANGTPVGDGSQGNYLVKKRILIDGTIPEPEQWEWADTTYVYYPEDPLDPWYREHWQGLLRQKTEPQGSIDPIGNITYYEYDNYGFVSKEWQGASLEGGLPNVNPQKRYYYDGLGRKILEADYLGKVEMNIYGDPRGLLTETRQYFHKKKYIDENVMDDSVVFEPGRYDDNILEDNQNDWWETRTFYSDYDPGTKPGRVIPSPAGTPLLAYYEQLPTSGNIVKYYALGKFVLTYELDDGYVDFHMTADGRPLTEIRGELLGAPYEPVFIHYVYDSMFRLVHKYSYFEYEGEGFDTYFKYIKHEENKYDASGNKICEKVYSVVRGQEGFEPYSGVLEKWNSYEYDILGRLTKQIVYSTEGGLNQTTEYGYDAVGNRIYVIDPAGKVIFSDYDNVNRKIRDYFAKEPVYDPVTGKPDFVATNPALKKEISYYNNNQIKDVTSYDYGGTTVLSHTEYTYDSRGRIWTVTEKINDTQDATTTYYYSDDGTRERVEGEGGYHIVIEDAEGKKTGIRLTYHGKPEIIIYPSGDYEQYSYYSEALEQRTFDNPKPDCKQNGLLKQKTVWVDGAAKHIRFTYDDYGKVQYKIYDDDDPQTQNDPYLEYSYTSRILGKYGMVKQITDHRAEIDRPGGDGSAFTFDYWYLSGKVRSYTDYDGYKVNYDYSSAYDQPTEVKVTDQDYPDNPIYWVKYTYDLAGRLTDVSEPLLGDNNLIAGFEYDENGNRKKLKYYLDGIESGSTASIIYTYNACECQCDNHLVAFSTSGVAGLDFSFDASAPGNIDGLGRLHNCSETLTKVGGGQVSHTCTYDYDMMSRLKYAKITDISPKPYIEYTNSYDDAGNLTSYIYNEGSGDVSKTYAFDGDQVLGYDDASKVVSWDENGQQTSQLSAVPPDYSLMYDWEGRLRKGLLGSDNSFIEAKYTPDGARVTKKKIWDKVTSYNYKYIVDVTGMVPVVLLVLNADSSNAILKTYIHANNQVIAQHDGAVTVNAPTYFYLHDRLGSVRQVIDNTGTVKNCYTYDPWGMPVGDETQTKEMLSNLYRFAGYVWDAEISQYYCFRRQYDPILGRFTSRDPVAGNYQEPMTLHKYLYCLNNPINKIDPSGLSALDFIINTIYGVNSYYGRLDAGLAGASDWWDILDLAISVNKWRENWFDWDNLTKNDTIRQMLLARGEGLMLRGMTSLIEAQYQMLSICDWGGVGKCLGWQAAKMGFSELVTWGICTYCTVAPEPITKITACGACITLRVATPITALATSINIVECFTQNCGK